MQWNYYTELKICQFLNNHDLLQHQNIHNKTPAQAFNPPASNIFKPFLKRLIPTSGSSASIQKNLHLTPSDISNIS